MTNRLSKETSLYLRQHAENPVDWFPWGDEAFARARAEGKPLLVSIGYSSCHWCHVMEHESFTNPALAELQNQYFVSVKVDREERPDVDRVYMAACQLLTQQGGWPLNVFLMPDGQPFFAGTYFPPEPRYGRPSWRQVLEGIHRAWSEKRDEVVTSAAEITAAIAREEASGKAAAPNPGDLKRAVMQLMARADREHGGFGGAPKFPNVMSLELLLRSTDRTGDPMAGSHAVMTAKRMAAGGIYDQLGGGFHRYTVDGQWEVPHFEKMLYDNGLLLRLFAEMLRTDPLPELEAAARGAVAWLQREMLAEDGSFFAAQDADSEGEEGKFFVWRPVEVAAAVGEADAAFACRLLEVREHGNFEHGQSVLARRESVAAVGARFGLTPEVAEAKAAEVIAKMLAVRGARIAPATDPKRIAAWNGLAVQGLARLGGLLGDAALVAMAARALRAVLDGFRLPDGRLARIRQRDDAGDDRAHTGAFLDDHAELCNGALDLFVVTGDVAHLRSALQLAEAAVARFFDEKAGTFGLAPNDGEQLVVSLRSAVDEATPSAVASMLRALQRLAQLVEVGDFESLVVRSLAQHGGEVAMAASGCSSLLRVVENGWLGLATVVAVMPQGATEEDLAAVRAASLAVIGADDLLVLHREGDAVAEPLAGSLVEGRTCLDGLATYYLCSGGNCSLPVTSWVELAAMRQQRMRASEVGG